MINKESIGQRIRRLRGERTQKDVARQVGVSRVSISNWERGETESLKSQHVESLAKALGTSRDYILYGEESPSSTKRVISQMIEPQLHKAYEVRDSAGHRYLAHDYTFVPRYGVELAAGAGTAVESEVIEDHIAFKTRWLVTKGLEPEELAVVTARGDSMADRIQDGDILLVDMRQESVADLRDGDVYALNIGNEARVKRLFRRIDGSIILHSDNRAPQFTDEIVRPDEQSLLRIVGKVVWIGGAI